LSLIIYLGKLPITDIYEIMIMIVAMVTCSSAATMYMARIGMTAPFIVMETDILSNGIPSNRV